MLIQVYSQELVSTSHQALLQHPKQFKRALWQRGYGRLNKKVTMDQARSWSQSTCNQNSSGPSIHSDFYFLFAKFSVRKQQKKTVLLLSIVKFKMKISGEMKQCVKKFWKRQDAKVCQAKLHRKAALKMKLMKLQFIILLYFLWLQFNYTIIHWS